jgi:hypothetical protein
MSSAPPASPSVSPGDTVLATGRLTADDRIVTLAAVGGGHYDRVLQTSIGLKVLTDIHVTGVRPGTVTLRGTWTGDAIVDAAIVDPAPLVSLPRHIGAGIDESVLPPGRASRSDLLAPRVLASLAPLRQSALLSYVAHRTPDGWVGVASACHPQAVIDALQPHVAGAFTVAETAWTPHDLDAVDESLEGREFRGEVLDTGRFVDPSGRLRASALVRVLRPEMAGALQNAVPGSLVLSSWISTPTLCTTTGKKENR